MVLMNGMCDLSQFVVVVLVTNESSATLTEYFFEHVLMKFGLCHLVVIDDGTLFKGSFVAMCKALDLNQDIFANRNYKWLTVGNFHRFLNKEATIVMTDRQSNNVFVLAQIAVECAWNSARIDGTVILRSTVTIGREFRFPIDIDLLALSQLNQNNAQSTIDQMKLSDSNRHFSSPILKL